MKHRLVIKIGGSLLFNQDYQINLEKIGDFSKIIKKYSNFDNIVIVCGGGIIARNYINAVRSFTRNEALCDLFGIYISRINAKLLISSLKEDAYPLVPKSMEELSIALLSKSLIVMGGLQPGQSTTSVALEVAEYIKAEQLVILTDVSGIYNKDPNKFKDAKLIRNLNYNQLQEIILKTSGDNQAAAGEYRIFDTVSLQILKRSKIKVLITSGVKLSDFEKFLSKNNDITGTFINET